MADELVFRAEGPGPDVDLTMVERRALLVIAAAVGASATRWAGLEPRSGKAQAVTTLRRIES